MTKAKPIAVVIEDDPVSADALRLIVSDWGAEIVFGLSTGAAFAALGEERAKAVRWIITDFNLGDAPDGVAGLRPWLPQIDGARVLVLSGSFGGRALEAAKAAGFDAMSKPATAAAITAWLERA